MNPESPAFKRVNSEEEVEKLRKARIREVISKRDLEFDCSNPETNTAWSNYSVRLKQSFSEKEAPVSSSDQTDQELMDAVVTALEKEANFSQPNSSASHTAEISIGEETGHPRQIIFAAKNLFEQCCLDVEAAIRMDSDGDKEQVENVLPASLRKICSALKLVGALSHFPPNQHKLCKYALIRFVV